MKSPGSIELEEGYGLWGDHDELMKMSAMYTLTKGCYGNHCLLTGRDMGQWLMGGVDFLTK